MPRIYRSDVYNAMQAVGLVPLYYHPDLETAQKVLAACVAGGAQVVEFYNRGEKALPVFTGLIDYAARAGLRVILGVGSVVDAPTAAHYINLGANFIVSPVLNAEMARLCNRRKIAYLPGCGTVGEISAAEELGAEIIKVFPAAELGGPNFIKAILGPMPWSRLMPSGGVEATRENVRAWFQAGACCIGMGSNLVRKDWLAAGNYNALQETVRQVIGWIAEK